MGCGCGVVKKYVKVLELVVMVLCGDGAGGVQRDGCGGSIGVGEVVILCKGCLWYRRW